MKVLRKLYKISRSSFSSANFNIKFPDVVLSDLKTILNETSCLNKIESDIIDNIHYFDCEQFCDLVCLFGDNKRGSADLWDLLERKIYDYDFNLIQLNDMYNANLTNPKTSENLRKFLVKQILKTEMSRDREERYNNLI